MIKILVNGAYGKMGQEACKAILQQPHFELVGQTGHEDNLRQAIQKYKAQVVVDLSTASAVYENTMAIINANAHPVIGTSGLLPDQIKTLQEQCAAKKLGGIIAPNFSIGAVLMMRFAKEAARYYQDVEIIEMHHTGKEDSPSGTALKTADMIATSQKNKNPVKKTREIIPGARGALHHDIPIHAIRLPGIMAAQEVIFGGTAETLSIRHHSLHRESFMPGICLACEKVVKLNQLVYGLENIL